MFNEVVQSLVAYNDQNVTERNRNTEDTNVNLKDESVQHNRKPRSLVTTFFTMSLLIICYPKIEFQPTRSNQCFGLGVSSPFLI